MIWIFFTILVIVLAYLGDEQRVKDRNIRTVARIALILLFSYIIAFCTEGSDKESYIRKFGYESFSFSWNNIKEALSFESDESEIGFVLLRNLCFMLGLSGVGFLFVVSLITNTLLVKKLFTFRNSVFVFFLYIMSIEFLQQANLSRQMLAASIGIYAIQYIETKDWKKYLIFVFLAFTIHRSSLVLLAPLPLVLIKEINFNILKIALFVLWIASLLMSYINIPLLEQMSTIFEGTKYAIYGNEDETFGLQESRIDIVYNFLIVLFFLFFKDSKYAVLAFWVVLGCALKNAAVSAIFLQRVAMFYTPMLCAFAPILLYDIQKGRRKPIMGMLFEGFVILFYLRILVLHYIIGDITPVGHDIISITEIFR